MLQTLDQILVDSSNIISVLLVFVFVLVDLKFPIIDQVLDLRPPDQSLPKDRIEYLETLQLCIKRDCLPLNIIFISLIFLLFPSVIEVLKTSRFNLIHFDLIRSLFLIITVCLVYFFYLSAKKIVGLIAKVLGARINGGESVERA